MELRKHAENVLGTDFDLRDFHYTILSNGPVPLNVLEKIINDWIQSKTKLPTPVGNGQITCKPTGTFSVACNSKTSVYLISALVSLLFKKH